MSTVVPQTFLLLLEQKHGLLIIPLVEPEAFHMLGLVASAREPLAPLPRALLEFAEGLDLSTEIERRISRPQHACSMHARIRRRSKGAPRLRGAPRVWAQILMQIDFVSR
jgi:hypothetical protein